jgi:protein required for attachment to host cells
VGGRIFLAQTVPDGRVELVARAELRNADYPLRGPDAPHVSAERKSDREAGPVHPHFEQRARHRMEIERRFAGDIAQQIAATVKDWNCGAVVLAAEPGMLGLLRELTQDALPAGVTLRSLARDYVRLTPEELARRLDLS